MDYTSSGISERIRVEMLDRVTRASIGPLEGASAWSITRNINRTVRGGGSLTVAPTTLIDWRRIMVRISVQLTLGPEVEEHVLLTALPLLTGDTRAPRGMTGTVTLADPTSQLDDIVGRNLGYAAGTVVTDTITEILAQRGLPAMVVPSAAALRAPLSWTPKDTWRSVITGLGDAIGYAAAWADAHGIIQVRPYILPRDRASLLELGAGRHSLTIPSVDVDARVEAPNHFVLVTGDESPLIAEAWNTDPASPYSTVNQRVVPYYEQVDAVDQETLDLALVRVMSEQSQPSTDYGVSWRWHPISPTRQAELGDVAHLYVPAAEYDGVVVASTIDTRASIEEMSWSWADGKPMAHVTGKLREVTP